MLGVAGMRKKQAPGGFDPKSIPGLEVWYDLDDISTLFQDSAATTPITAGGQQVGCIKDKALAAANRNLIQATAAARPYYYVSGGLPAVSTAALNTHHLQPQTYFTLSNPCTMFVVARVPSSTAAVVSFPRIIGASLNRIQIYASTAGRYLASTWAANVPFILTYNHTGGTSYGYKNGGGAEAISPGATVAQGFWLFSFEGAPTAPANTMVAEVLVYSGTLSPANREAVRDYLNAKWGVY